MSEPRNNPALLRADPAAALSFNDPDQVRVSAEIVRLEAAMARMALQLGFFDEPSQFAAALRRLA